MKYLNIKIALLLPLTVYLVFNSPQIWASECIRLFGDDSIAMKKSVAEEMIGNAQKALTSAKIYPTEGVGQEGRWDEDGFISSLDYERWLRPIINRVIELGDYIPEKHELSDFFLNNILEKRRSMGKSNHVLDLMGSGLFVHAETLFDLALSENYPDRLKEEIATADWSAVDSSTGLRFESFPRDQLPTYYPVERVPREVLGDIINPATWSKLNDSLRKREIPHLDLVTMNPIGGWQQASWNNSVETSLSALKYIIGNVLARLSPDGNFYFTVDIISPGKLSEHPILKDLVHEVEQKTSYKLILVSKMTYKGDKTVSLSGALLPK